MKQGSRNLNQLGCYDSCHTWVVLPLLTSNVQLISGRMLEASHPEELEQRRREDEEEAKIAVKGFPEAENWWLGDNSFLLGSWPIAGSVLGRVINMSNIRLYSIRIRQTN